MLFFFHWKLYQLILFTTLLSSQYFIKFINLTLKNFVRQPNFYVVTISNSDQICLLFFI